MIYTSVSIQEVISRVIRNTRIQDSSYIIDMVEWIPEAMGYMKTRMEQEERYKDINIVFHKGRLPCGPITVVAVEYCGRRLKTSNTVKHYQTGHNLGWGNKSEGGLFTSVITEKVTPNENHVIDSTIKKCDCIKDVMCCAEHPTEYYKIEMDYLNTSFKDGSVRIHFLAQPIDGEGFPLIPDNENYKEALYYYIRAKMVGCGFKDRVFSEDTLMQRFEGYAARAKGEISYPTPDMMDARIASMVRFIPPENYWDNFFRTDNHEKMY